MIISRLCHFLLDKEKGQSDAMLRYRIKWDGKQVAFSVGYRVTIEKWNLETQRCVANTSHGRKRIQASVINRKIQDMEQLVTEVFTHFEALERVPSEDEFRAQYKKRDNRTRSNKESQCIIDVLDIFVRNQASANMWTKATRQKFGAMRNHLLMYNEALTFSDLTGAELASFTTFLRDTLQLRNSTIIKKIGFLKWFLNWATIEGYNTSVAYKSYSPRFKNISKTIIFLDWEELMCLYELPLDGRIGLEQVRDVFCFCCFTSLRYSDVANLKRSNVYRSHISITTIKTNDSLRIELNKYSRAILDKYKGVKLPNDLALPVISNQKMNKAIKEVCKIAGFDTPITLTYYKGNERYDDVYPKYELMSTHAGRRTFICNALMMGIQPEIVMKWTGHSDYNAMKPYIDVADRSKAEAMAVFDRR